ncbi:MAG: glutathione peroxidase [Prevotella sp.]|nr:glutathione peroxidase [Prevotella sp.]
MKRLMIFCLLATACVLGISAQDKHSCCGECAKQDIYDIKVKDDAGKDVSLADYKGKVLLIVNTATRCGFTPQYKELEALYEKYHAEGLEILDFPCNQFGEQAPGTIQEIHQFCTANFDIQFPQFDKIDVNGANESPLFTYLKQQRGFGGFDLTDQTGKFMDDMLRKKDAEYDKNSDIKWNFTKFLVSRDGRVLKRYEPTEKVATIESDICAELKAQCVKK